MVGHWLLSFFASWQAKYAWRWTRCRCPAILFLLLSPANFFSKKRAIRRSKSLLDNANSCKWEWRRLCLSWQLLHVPVVQTSYRGYGNFSSDFLCFLWSGLRFRDSWWVLLFIFAISLWTNNDGTHESLEYLSLNLILYLRVLDSWQIESMQSSCHSSASSTSAQKFLLVGIYIDIPVRCGRYHCFQISSLLSFYLTLTLYSTAKQLSRRP